MTWLEALLLGLLQGITEFLPVSSSGHIEIGKALFAVVNEDNLAFSIIVHAATMLSIVVVFWREIMRIFRGLLLFRWNEETQFMFYIIVSMIPVGIVGLVFEKYIDQLFEGRLALVGSMLLITSVLLFITRRKSDSGKKIGLIQAIIIGLAQAIAVIPGISRSGATIATALIMGVNKQQATRFSFLMVIPPIAGATLLKIKDIAASPSFYQTQAAPLIIGFIAAFVSGLLACKWMISLVDKGKISWFAVYCAIAGLGAILVGLFVY